MIVKINTEETTVTSIIDTTPEDLMVIARRMQLAAEKAMPGEEIIVPVTDRITLKYNPEITSATLSSRTNTMQGLGASSMTSIIDRHIRSQVAIDEAIVEQENGH